MYFDENGRKMVSRKARRYQLDCKENSNALVVICKRPIGSCRWKQAEIRENHSTPYPSQTYVTIFYYSCNNPKEAWDTLKSHLERVTLANKLFLEKKKFRA